MSKPFKRSLTSTVIFTVLLACGCGDRNGPWIYKVARAQIGAFSEALEMLRSDCGRYPTTAEGLKALASCPVGTNAMPQWRQYLDKVPLDPWDNPYVYHCPGIHNPDSFDLYCCGADGVSKSGGDDYDDVNNWDPLSPRDPNRAENLAGLKWSVGLGLLALATVIGYRQIFKPTGNLHGLIAIGLIFGVAAMGSLAALSGWYWLSSTFVGDGFFLASYMGVVWLAISGVHRGCQVSKFCGWFVIVTAILLVLVMFLAPRFA